MQLVIEIRVAPSIIVASTVTHLQDSENEKVSAYETPVVILTGTKMQEEME